MEKVLEEGVFDNVSENAIIYAGELNNTSSLHGYIMGQSFRWGKYVFAKTGEQRNICDFFNDFKYAMQKNPEQDIYYITKYEDQKSSDILLVLLRVNEGTITLENKATAFAAATANEATVFYYSANKDFVFQFVIPQCSEEAVITVNNQMQKSVCGINAIRIENTKKRKAITSFTLQSDDPFLVRDFAVSNIGFANEEVFYLY